MNARADRFHPGLTLAAAFAIVAALLILYLIVEWSRLDGEGLLGPDSYMRALRVLDLFLDGGWYDPHFSRTNAPYGETLHWGRPLDAVLYVGARILTAFTDPRTAVYVMGLAIGPIVAFSTIPVWSWGTRPFLGTGAFLLILALSGLMFRLFVNLSIGRADHHGFLALLFLVQLAAVFRLAFRTDDHRLAVLIGVAGGVAVWASVISLISQLAFSCMLAVLFLRDRRGSLAPIVHYTCALAATLAIGLLLERPPSMFFFVEFKRFSIVHLTIAASAAATWGVVRGWLGAELANTRNGGRLGVLAVGAGVPLLVTLVLFPKFFLGPLVDYDPKVNAAFLATITEFQSLFPSSIGRFRQFLIDLGPALIGAGYLLIDLRNRDFHRRSLDLVLLTGMAIYIPLALWSGRLAIYAQVLALAPWAMAITRLMSWTAAVKFANAQLPLRGFAVLALVAGPLLVSVTLGWPREASAPRERCDWVAMGRFLSNAGDDEGRTDILFTYFIRGPEMAWRTPYGMVGTPYGNTAALRDTAAIFKAKHDADAKAVVDARGIDLVVICRGENENALYRNGRDGSFLSRLEHGLAPGWLRPIPLPGRLPGPFKLFRVVEAPPG